MNDQEPYFFLTSDHKEGQLNWKIVGVRTVQARGACVAMQARSIIKWGMAVYVFEWAEGVSVLSFRDSSWNFQGKPP